MKKIFVTIIIAVILCVSIRIVFGEICTVPSPSMEPTILVGDWLWIDKLTYGAHLPERWSDIPILNVFTWNKDLY